MMSLVERPTGNICRGHDGIVHINYLIKKREFEKEIQPIIDRIDNTKGYIKENIVVVSTRANLLKSDATINELVMVAKFYNELKEKQN